MCLFSALRKNLEKAAVAVVEAVKSAAEDHRTVCRSSRLLLLVSAWRPSGRYVAGIDHFSPFFVSFFLFSLSNCSLYREDVQVRLLVLLVVVAVDQYNDSMHTDFFCCTWFPRFEDIFRFYPVF
jgi:hypothetical protein